MAMWHATSTPRSQPVLKSRRREELRALPIVVAAFLLRLWIASGTFLNPDEALHFLVANKLSWAAAFKASLSTAHPPGLIFVLYFWRHLGTSELVLRLPSILAGTVFCWLFFRWLERVFDRNAAWIGLLLASFLPPVIALSTEIRQYAFLLMFMAGAMDLFEQALAQRSWLKMSGSGLCLCLALTFHYSALLFALAFGIYGLLRILKHPTDPEVLASWGIGQLGALALFGYFYVHHIAHLAANTMSQQTIAGWLSNSYYHPGKQNVLLFAFARTFGVFQFVFGQLAIGDVAGIAFFASIVLLLRRRTWIVAAFLALPFLVACALAIGGKYPYGGTRHSAFLVPFAIAGASVAIDFLLKGRLKSGFVVAALILFSSALFGKPHRPYITRADQSSAHMQQAVRFLREHVRPGESILTDYQSGLLLGHYLCEQKPMVFNTSVTGFEEFTCQGLRVISTGPQVQIFSDATFLDPRLWASLSDGFGVLAGQKVWVLQAGWDLGLAAQGPLKSFGKNIEVSEFVAPKR